MAVSASANLSVTVAHAISFLTRPLIASYPATTLIKLQLVLEANLTALYAPTWVVREPLRSSGRRCLTLSPDCLPPRPIYSACIAAGVQWFEWIAQLGGREFDFFVDPGCVTVRYGRKGSPDCQMISVWADEVPSPAANTHEPAFPSFEASITLKQQQTKSKTLAQQLLEEDAEEDEQIFAMIADEVSAPKWRAPIPMRSSSPLSSISSHSRCSSRSSNSSSGFSFSSADSSSTATSMSAASSKASSPKSEGKQSRRERARQARVFIDTTKTEVTPYDGGKTTVLTGGVMLGGAPKAKKAPVKPHHSNNMTSNSWRSVRV
ncbi:hypothetical protein BDQ12DRAFT_679300 [Crucibulum laeve]|uniref:Anti-proliferative protein domain-containing protein n=1 Tax=Crucibulum laeve TaxID=68775 RepID=A0A5C3M7A7_9AGAR|nr:hypothetical protein BDQ12DRAFT_679300 [Crucibulum laeve]